MAVEQVEKAEELSASKQAIRAGALGIWNDPDYRTRFRDGHKTKYKRKEKGGSGGTPLVSETGIYDDIDDSQIPDASRECASAASELTDATSTSRLSAKRQKLDSLGSSSSVASSRPTPEEWLDTELAALTTSHEDTVRHMETLTSRLIESNRKTIKSYHDGMHTLVTTQTASINEALRDGIRELGAQQHDTLRMIALSLQTLQQQQQQHHMTRD